MTYALQNAAMIGCATFTIIWALITIQAYRDKFIASIAVQDGGTLQDEWAHWILVGLARAVILGIPIGVLILPMLLLKVDMIGS